MAARRSAAACVASALPACLAVLFLAHTTTPATAACISGVLQLNPQPANVQYDPCRYAFTDRNSLKAVCGAAFKVTVTNNIVRMVPVETRSFNWSGPGPTFPPPPPFDCKDHNASGLFRAGSTSAATVMLYDDFGGPLSNFTKTGPSQVSLDVGHTYNYRGPSFACTFNYTVISGCVLGAKPPSATPAPCPSGHITRTGRYGLKYCAVCPKGTYSAGGAATTCTPCPIGTASSNAGVSKCRPCNGLGEYAAVEGLDYCQYCSTYDNKWTDGKAKCESCPAGSVPSQTKPNQCVRCYAGKKCCTVNWDSSCPKCTSNAAPKAAYTSIFALESTTPASCLASNYAICSPKINITIDSSCMISISNMDNQNNPATDVFCSWNNALPIKGAAAKAVVDLAKLGDYYSQGAALVEGNVTAVASPYLDVTIAPAKCTLRYRALTKPAAAILGAAPKPAAPTPCPAGKYIDTSTDTKPGPCLPCPPGTFSTKPGTTGACTRCPAGTFARKLGSTGCVKCPPARISRAGAASCAYCDQVTSFYANPDRVTCSSCPSDTSVGYPGAGACLGTVYGSTCCAAGLCGSQVPCGSQQLTPRQGDSRTFQSVFRLVSSSVSGGTCKNATFLSCLRPNTTVVIETYSYGTSLNLQLTNPQTTCATNSSYTLGQSKYGDIAATNRALVSGFEDPVADSVSYEILSNAAARTFTMYLSSKPGYITWDAVTQTPAIKKECSATFELVNGFFLDIKPAAASVCPTTAARVVVDGRTFCQYCGLGTFRNSTGSCQSCPAGTYQPVFGGTVCKACPAGNSCFENSWSPSPCSLGYFGAKTRLPNCLQCPANTVSGYGANKGCTRCPAGTIAPKTASVCGVPWQTKF